MATDTGCLYGLTFVTHFYAARKSILAPAIGTAELLNGQLVEATRAAIQTAAREPGCKLIPVISLCVAETAGMPEELLPRSIGEAEVVLVRVPAYAIHSHPEAKDVALEALVRRLGDWQAEREERSAVLVGEVFPGDQLAIATLLRSMGIETTIALPGRSIDDLCRAGRATMLAPLHPFYKRMMRLFREHHVAVAGGAPVGISGSYAWIKAIGALLNLDTALVQRIADTERDRAQAVVEQKNLRGACILLTGYEGSELSYARALVEAGAHVPYVSTSIGADPLVLPDELWLTTHGVQEIVYRKTFEDDTSAIKRYAPDFVMGTTPVCAFAKERGIPAMYFTNQAASRPFFLSSGLEAILTFMHTALNRGPSYRAMYDFFADI